MKDDILLMTTVGVSMFSNYRGNKEFNNNWNRIKTENFDKWEDYQSEIEEIRDYIKKWDNFDCAEWQTLKKIKERFKGTVSTYLVTSDTIAGHLAGEILEQLLPTRDIIFQGLKRIVDFDVISKDKNKIRRGLDNYVNYLMKDDIFVDGYNISGGYKAIIPTTTLIASYTECTLYYNFEDSQHLIEIPPFPFDWPIDRFEFFEEFFEKLQKEGGLSYESDDYKKFERSIENPENNRLFQTLTVIEDDLVIESEIGRIFREAYDSRKDIKLLESRVNPEDKMCHLSDHHSKKPLFEFWKVIRKSPYVEKCISSTQYYPRERKLIYLTNPNLEKGELIVVLHRNLKKYGNDAGYAMLIKTTGRNQRETKKIAKILAQEYDK